MKQIALAVHNHHDTTGFLPAIAMFPNRPTLLMFIYPYMEQQALYDRMNSADLLKVGEDVGVASDPVWFESLTTEEKKGFGSVPSYKCPSSRGSGGEGYKSATVTGSNGDLGQLCTGPLTDYAPLYCRQDGTSNYWWQNAMQGKTVMLRDNRGPFRPASLTFAAGSAGAKVSHWNKITQWSFRDKMGWWSDGSSNQLCFAEKHIPTWAFDNTSANACAWDGGYHYAGAVDDDADDPKSGDHVWSAFRFVGNHPNLVAKGRNDPNRSDETAATAVPSHEPDAANKHFKFDQALGSAHSGVFNVVMGDGSVRSVSVTTDYKTIEYMTNVKDGHTVSLQ